MKKKTLPHVIRTHRRPALLLGGQFLLILAAAFMHQTPFSNEIFLITLCLVLMTGIYALIPETRYSRLFIFIGLCTLACNILNYFFPAFVIDTSVALVNLGFLLWIIVLLIHHVFLTGRADTQTIIGAASLYLVIGIAFGFIYMLVDQAIPHSFSIASPDRSRGIGALLSHFFYYSYVTLATVGFGDITPIKQTARYLSVIEALISQLYLTILVARLVGLHLAQRK